MDRVRKIRFRRGAIIWLVVFLSVLAAVYFGVALLRPAIRARYLFSQLQTLELEHSTFEDAERLAKKIGAAPINGPCDRSSCEWSAKVDNAKLPRWWRGPGETFLVSFTVKDSIVVRKNTGSALVQAMYFIRPLCPLKSKGIGVHGMYVNRSK